MSSTEWPRRVFFFLVLLPMLLAFPYVRALNNPNELVRVYTVIALVENGTYQIDEQVESFGWVNDMAHIPKKDGTLHYYMVKAPGIVYAGVPGYALFSKVIAPLLGKRYPGHAVAAHSPEEENALEEQRLWWVRMGTWAMRLTASQLPCFLFLVWLERYLRAFSADTLLRCIAVAAAGLGTNYLAYAHMFASHSQYAIVAFVAFAILERELRRSGGDPGETRASAAVAAGFLTSTCVTLEYQALFMTLVMALFAIFVFYRPSLVFAQLVSRLRVRSSGLHVKPVTPSRILAFIAGGLLNIPHVMWFHYRAYGNPFTPGHKQLETAQFAAEHKMGLWGVSWPTFDRIGALAVDPGFGFFGMSPFMWLGLLSVPLILLWPNGLSPNVPSERRSHLRVLTIAWFSLMAVVFAVNAGFVEWRAGWTVGPRYLVVCAPFFALGALLTLEWFAGSSPARRSLARGIGAGLALASVMTIGTVGLLVDTLPDTIRRPFAQFFLPMARVGLVPHHVGEWFGWTSGTLWYVLCAAMLLAPAVMGIWSHRNEARSHAFARIGAFVIAATVGVVPAFTQPKDGSALFVLHPSTVFFATSWEPRNLSSVPSKESSARTE